MIIPTLIACVLVALTGLAVKFAVTRWSVSLHVSWHEFFAALLVATCVVAPATMFVGNKLSVSNALTYEEFYNGVETKAAVASTECSAGSSGSNASSGYSNCNYDYVCGSYTYTEAYPDTEYYTGADGKPASRTVIKYREVPAYIYCPYATMEYNYVIEDSIGGEYWFPTTYIATDAKPAGNEAIPPDIPRGSPPDWETAKQRLDAGDPRPVTRLFEYDNFILAAKDELLLPFSDDVDRYLEQEILPEHTAGITEDPLYGYDSNSASKASFVGVEVEDESVWQETLQGFNAALGSKLQGDMHVVFIDSSLVDDPDTYLNALKAYWTGDAFGKRAIAKNSIIVAIGVRDNEVDWARASTGMPFGNETMTRAIINGLSGTEMDPQAIFGNPTTVIIPATSEEGEDEVRVRHSSPQGVIEQIVFNDFPFKRACMLTCDDGEIGYGHLIDKISPSGLTVAIMVLVAWVIMLPFWAAVAYYEFFGSFTTRKPKAPTRSLSSRYTEIGH